MFDHDGMQLVEAETLVAKQLDRPGRGVDDARPLIEDRHGVHEGLIFSLDNGEPLHLSLFALGSYMFGPLIE